MAVAALELSRVERCHLPEYLPPRWTVDKEPRMASVVAALTPLRQSKIVEHNKGEAFQVSPIPGSTEFPQAQLPDDLQNSKHVSRRGGETLRLVE